MQILLVLADGEKHGYSILQQISRNTASSMIRVATLYTALNVLIHDGLIEKSSESYEDSIGDSRLYYRLTFLGRMRVEEELEHRHSAEEDLGPADPNIYLRDLYTEQQTHAFPSEVPLASLPLGKIAKAALRLDTAVPSKVFINRTFELATKVSPASFDTLKEEGLDLVKSADADVFWQKGQTGLLLRVRIQSPDCIIHGEHEVKLFLKRKNASPTFYFQLTPKISGQLSILVQLFQETYFMGNIRVATVVIEPEVYTTQNLSGKKGAKQKSRNKASITCAQLFDDNDDIMRLIEAHKRRLLLLETQRASKGINTDPVTIIEIEDIEQHIALLQERIDARH
jgi:DNA-binding PadR family transcriptional regulator